MIEVFSDSFQFRKLFAIQLSVRPYPAGVMTSSDGFKMVPIKPDREARREIRFETRTKAWSVITPFRFEATLKGFGLFARMMTSRRIRRRRQDQATDSSWRRSARITLREIATPISEIVGRRRFVTKSRGWRGRPLRTPYESTVERKG